ncbi:MAG: DUF6178 family protein [Myxococcales bacterium]
MLETPELPAQIQALPAPVLGKLIAHVGLEDAGELVALATTEQLACVFDEDLWQSPEAGQDERFDSERFVLWLSILLEAGDRAVAERLAELPQDLVTLAFHRHVLVLTEDALRAELTADDDEAEAAEKAFESCLSEELDEYQLIWRGGDGWDDVLSALLAFDRDHHDLAVDLLERCAQLSREYIDDNGGLYEVLSSDEMLESDLAAERETRRAEHGYVAPSQAAAFLRLARKPDAAGSSLPERDPLTRAYFRELSRSQAPTPHAAASASAATGAATAAVGGRLAGLLVASGITREATPRLLSSATAASDVSLLQSALSRLAEIAPAAANERSEELAYLSNVLVAGCSVEGRRLRPLEAVEHAIAAVSLGLWLLGGGAAENPAAAAEQLAQHPCDALFRLAFTRALEPTLRAKPKNAAKDLARVRTLLKTMKV